MRIKNISIVLCLFLAFVLAGCTSNNTQDEVEENESKIKVSSTIFPIHSLVSEVGGDKVDTVLILPPGSSPHTYEATPSQIKDVQDTDIFFRVGGEVDEWIASVANTVSDPNIISLNDNLELMPFGLQGDHVDEEDEYGDEEEHDNHEAEMEDHEHGELDPHTWLDPQMAIQMIQKIAEELGKIDDSNAEYYQENADSLMDNLNKKDQEWKDSLAGLDNTNIIVFHDAWGYFADHFGIDIVASFEPFPGKTPTPQYIAELEEEIEENNVKTIFVEPQLSQEAVNTLANDLNIEVKVLDPLGGLEERDSYINLIDFNIENIYQSLK